MTEYAAVDIETTGLNKKTDKIIELGVLLYDLDPVTGTVVEGGEWTSVVEPGTAISQEIFELTGLVNEDFEGAPSIGEVADEFMAKVNQGETLVTYNGTHFDLAFLAREIGAAWGAYMEGGEHIDMLEVVRRPDVGQDWKGLGAHKLPNVFKRLRCVQTLISHRALGDCHTLAGVHAAVELMGVDSIATAIPDPFLDAPDVSALLSELRVYRHAVERFNRAERLLKTYFALLSPGTVHLDGFQVTIKENKPRRRLRKDMTVPEDYYELGPGSTTASIKEEL